MNRLWTHNLQLDRPAYAPASHTMAFTLQCSDTCSSASHLLSVPRHNLSFGSRAFRTSAPTTWNSLPPHILQSQTLSSFRHLLKTHYFQSAYPAPYRPSLMRPDSLLRLWRYINHLLTYLIRYSMKVK